MHLAQHHRLVSGAHRPSLAPLPKPRVSHRTCVSTASVTVQQDASQLVDQVLALVLNTDGGMTLPKQTKEEVDGYLEQLEAHGRTQQPRPNKNQLLWGNYVVAYTSMSKTASQRGEAAGGRFRNGIGRALFRTEGLFQSCLQPDLCCNKVAFRLFGIIQGAVGLRGKITPVEGENDDTVHVRFEPTMLSFGPLHLRLGFPSEVQLTTTYLDERVRLGKGGRGSLFVFTRGGAADEAEMDQVGTQKTSHQVRVLATLGYVAVMLGALAAVLARPVPAVLKGLAFMVLMTGTLMAAVLKNGGIVPDDDSAVTFNQPNGAAKPIVG